MRVLVIGGGGREHALCWKLAQTPGVQLHASPGNPGISLVAECHPAGDYAALAQSLGADLTVVGPEAPLAMGIVDQFRVKGLAIVGPTAAAARLESSKTFSKDFMLRAGIPTARFISTKSAEATSDALRSFGFPVVLKADGLAGGKGVVIAHDRSQAERAIAELLTAGSSLVIEEFLAGEEVSFIVISDGASILPLEATQDHKAVNDGDTGPNTGGMGAYCDGRILTDRQTGEIMDTVILPAISRMSQEGTPFTGFLYAGLMMTADGPKVLEFNARLGDPETQVLMHRMEGDFAAVLHATAHAELKHSKLAWKSDPSVCVVLAAAGYPGTVRSGDVIRGVEDCPATVFHAGTKLTKNGLETAGGRVLGVTSSGPDLLAAIRTTYAAAGTIHFEGMHYRADIGRKGLKRW
jgi:phosphoribosylamine--glycine ligase